MRFPFWPRRRNVQLSEEIRSHLDMAMRDRIDRGESPAEAQLSARREFGSAALVADVTRDQWRFRWLADFAQDLRYSARTLHKSPGFTAIALLTLALGIGVNTTLFTAFNAVALKPLPVRDASSVVRLVRWFLGGRLGTEQFLFSYPEYLFYRDQNPVVTSLIAVSLTRTVAAALPATRESNAGRFSEPIALRGQLVSANYFSGLGVQPALGRTFVAEEERSPDARPVVVLSFPAWQRKFGADPQAVGSVIHLNGTAFTVIGIAPHDFIGTANPPEVPDFWVPLGMQAQLLPGQDWLHRPSDHEFQLLARLAPQTNLRQGGAAVQLRARQFEQAHPISDPQSRTTALTLQPATYFGETSDLRFRAFVALLMVVVGAVLLVACANLANMLLARSAHRRRELGIRLALGASRSRLIRQLLTESILLALLGGAAGLLFSVWAGNLLWLSVSQLVQELFDMDPSLIRVAPDIRVFSYALAISVVTGILFGLLPALRSSRCDLTLSLKEEGSAIGRRLSHSRLRNSLVVAQVAVSLVLLVTSGLLVRGLLRSQTVHPGFDAERVFPLGLYFDNDPAKANAVAQRVLEQLTVSPGVEALGLAERVPLASTWTSAVLIDDTHASPSDLPGSSLANRVSRGYFAAMGVPIVHGRNFTANEDLIGAPLAIVSESAGRRFWPREDPLGKRLKFDVRTARGASVWREFEVIGVAKDVRNANLSRVDPAFLYFPTSAAELFNCVTLLRLYDDSEKTQSQIRAALESATGRTLPGFGLTSLAVGPLRTQRLMPQTFAFFAVVLAGLALALAAVGMYGIVAYAVSQRTREIGIRMALGAAPAEVLKLVVRQGMSPVLIGAALGMIFSLGVSGILRAILVIPGSVDLLFGVSSFDPLTFAGLLFLMACVALVACYIPARRAIRVDPIVALRYE